MQCLVVLSLCGQLGQLRLVDGECTLGTGKSPGIPVCAANRDITSGWTFSGIQYARWACALEAAVLCEPSAGVLLSCMRNWTSVAAVALADGLHGVCCTGGRRYRLQRSRAQPAVVEGES